MKRPACEREVRLTMRQVVANLAETLMGLMVGPVVDALMALSWSDQRRA